jgi:D-erythrose 4-phosphate dehydrogenase
VPVSHCLRLFTPHALPATTSMRQRASPPPHALPVFFTNECPMTRRIAINGYGRIGRAFQRALWESHLSDELCVVHINEPADLDSMVYLTRFDSTHGRFPGHVERRDNDLVIGGKPISISHAREPEGVDWAALGIDLLVECSGQYSERSQLQRFIDAGVPRLLLSHPGGTASDVDATIVYGVNQQALTGAEQLVSGASCTSNAVVPVLHLLDQQFGIEQVFLNTLHSVMNDQPLADGYHHTDLRRTRSAIQSIIPVATGLANGVERLLPQLSGRVHAKAIRVPTLNVSAIDLVVNLQRDASTADVNALLKAAAAGPLAGLMAYTEEVHASIDFNHDVHSAIVDASQTYSDGGRLVNLMIWFDNEWGFSNRLIDVARQWLSAKTA